MTNDIKVGDTVRINERYGEDLDEVGDNLVGTEFVVTQVVYQDYGFGYGDHYIAGDPENGGLWPIHYDKVEEEA